MIPPFISFPMLRRLSRWLAAIAALGLAGFMVAAALMFFWVLPNIADHRDTVARLMSRALGQRVTLEAVSGVWQQARPEFRLQGLRVHDAAGRPTLYLPELEATFAWRSLLFLEPRFSTLELLDPVLAVRRARDGHWYVGGIPINPADPASGFSEWLLRQGKVHIGRASLTWLDEVRAAPPLSFTNADFTLTNHLREHHFQLTATPPATLARPLSLDARLTIRDASKLETWQGRIESQVAGVAFPKLATWLDVPYQPREGWGALTLRLDVARGSVTGVIAGLDVRELALPLASELPALRLAHALGEVAWVQGEDGQRLAVRQMRVRLPGLPMSAPFDAAYAWNARDRELSASDLALANWQRLASSLPLPEAWRARWQAQPLQGRFDTLLLRWRGAQPDRHYFEVDARFTGLGLAATATEPGLSGLSGSIKGDAAAGNFKFSSLALGLVLPNLFREPNFSLALPVANGSWRKTPRGHRFAISESRFANVDLAGTLDGDYEWIAGQRGVIDLNARLSRAAGKAVYRYFPKQVGDTTVNWLKHGVLAGGSNDVRVKLKGDLANFPFDRPRTGEQFEIDVKVQDAAIDYVTGWPRIEGISGQLLFQGKQMRVKTERARIYGVALAPVTAVIPDLLHHEELLQVDGVANGPVQDFIRFTQFSPVGERLRGVTDALTGTGAMRLALSLRIPLRHSDDTTVAGRVSFLGNTLYPAALPRIEQVRGDIDFTHKGLTARQLSAQLLGGAVQVNAQTRESGVHITAKGRATAAGLAAWVGDSWARRLQGDAHWSGQLELNPDGERVRIESDLVGMTSALPSPLNKLANQPLPLMVVSEPVSGGRQQELRLGRILGAVWQSTPEHQLSRGELRFGGAASLPTEPGLRLAGSGRGIDLSDWIALMPSGGDGAMPVSAIDLAFSSFDLMGRRFSDVRLQGRFRNGLLRTSVSGQELAGTLTWRPASDQPARLSAQFRQLTIPAPAATRVESDADGKAMRAQEFPLLDLSVEDFRLEERPMGKLDVVAHGTSQGLVIDRLELNHPDSVLTMSGLWREYGKGETRADLKLEVRDVGKLLARYGYKDTVRRGTAEIQGEAVWEGSPADFRFGTLAGTLEFKSKGGQFLKLDPGAAKLLGVLSLQSLPRRLSFDFRDIFNEGYAYDEIAATLRIARGVVYSDNFRMKGPAAKVNMSGLADLNQESVQLRVKVIPKLSEGVAVAGALIGGPIAGVGALAAQKLLRDPLEEAISQEYMVSGGWLTPDVKKLAKAKAAPVNEP
ncbi:MAG: YhdP family protein [Thiobacillus sp.]